MVHFAEISQAPCPTQCFSILDEQQHRSAKKLSQILANNIDNRGKGVGLRIYVRYCWSITLGCKTCLEKYFSSDHLRSFHDLMQGGF